MKSKCNQKAKAKCPACRAQKRPGHTAAPAARANGKGKHVNPGSGKRARQAKPDTLAAEARRLRAAAQQPQPRYNTEARFDTGLRYVTDDPPPPTGKAKVKLELRTRTDDNLIGFGHSHEEAITGNPNYPAPQPSPAVFAAKLTELETKVAELDNHRVIGKGLTDERDAIRAEFELLFTQRGTYVELASGGDATIITSAGLPVRNTPAPMGVLPFPGNLRVDLNGVAGEMTVRWMPVGGAKSYMLEMAEVVDGVTGAFSLVYMGGKFSHRLTDMVIGKTYAFRVAAVGGEDGRSAWSPEVWRAAA